LTVYDTTSKYNGPFFKPCDQQYGSSHQTKRLNTD